MKNSFVLRFIGCLAFFLTFSATPFSVSCTWFGAVQQALHAQLICCRTACGVCMLSLCCLRLCVHGALRRLLAAVSGTNEWEDGSPCGSPGTMQTQGRWATVSDTWESNTLQASGTIAAVRSDQVIPDHSCQ